MDKDSNKTDRDELRGRFTRFMEVCIRNARCNYLKVQLRRVPTVSIEEVPELLLAEECKPSQVNNDDFDFEEEKLSEAFRTLPLMRQRILELLSSVCIQSKIVSNKSSTQSHYKTEVMSIDRT